MCGTCGCGAPDGRGTRFEGGTAHGHEHHHHHDEGDAHDHGHAHEHTHAHEHGHDHGHVESRVIALEAELLGKNDRFADANRQRLAAAGVFALNLVSSPGSGKTTLLVRTIEALSGRLPVAVIEGDQETSNDAERIRATGVEAVQINTGKACHLDAHMIGHAMDRLTLRAGGLLFIENVGNLVCPAGFDLGEAHKVAVISVTEGEDKPLKYPDMFAAADLLLVNKTDLLPHLDFDLEACIANARRINPRIAVMQLSARTGEGFGPWVDWLMAGAAGADAAPDVAHNAAPNAAE